MHDLHVPRGHGRLKIMGRKVVVARHEAEFMTYALGGVTQQVSYVGGVG